MHMVARDYAFDDVYVQFLANLPDDLADTKTERTLQQFVTIFGDPDDVIAMIENCVYNRATC